MAKEITDYEERVISEWGKRFESIPFSQMQDYFIEDLKKYLKQNGHYKDEMMIFAQFRKVIINRAQNFSGPPANFQIGRILNCAEASFPTKIQRLTTFKELMDKARFVFQKGDLLDRDDIRGSIELGYLDAVMGSPTGKNYSPHPFLDFPGVKPRKKPKKKTKKKAKGKLRKKSSRPKKKQARKGGAR